MKAEFDMLSEDFSDCRYDLSKSGDITILFLIVLMLYSKHNYSHIYLLISFMLKCYLIRQYLLTSFVLSVI